MQNMWYDLYPTVGVFRGKVSRPVARESLIQESAGFIWVDSPSTSIQLRKT